MRSRGGGLQRSGEDNRELGYEIRRALWWWKGIIRMGLVNMKTGEGWMEVRTVKRVTQSL